MMKRKRIERLRKNGNSFSRIADITGLSRDSVRMYLQQEQYRPRKKRRLMRPAVRKGTCGKHRKGKEGVVINSWFEDSKGEKNIELVWSNPLREVGFIANGMTPSELRRRLEMEIRVWEMMRKEKSES